MVFEFLRVVGFNVGGFFYMIMWYIMIQFLDFKLVEFFNLEIKVFRDLKGNYFIDRDGGLFKYVFNFLWIKKLVLFEEF